MKDVCFLICVAVFDIMCHFLIPFPVILYIYVKHILTRCKRKTANNIKKLATLVAFGAGIMGDDRAGIKGGYRGNTSMRYYITTRAS